MKTDSFGWTWSSLLGEIDLIDPDNGHKYTLVVGYVDLVEGLYIRLWKTNSREFCGGSAVWRPCINAPSNLVKTIKDCAMRIEKMKAFI